MNLPSLHEQVTAARKVQPRLSAESRSSRERLLAAYAEALKAARETLIQAVVADAKKTTRDASAEVDGAVDIIVKPCAIRHCRNLRICSANASARQ